MKSSEEQADEELYPPRDLEEDWAGGVGASAAALEDGDGARTHGKRYRKRPCTREAISTLQDITNPTTVAFGVAFGVVTSYLRRRKAALPLGRILYHLLVSIRSCVSLQ